MDRNTRAVFAHERSAWRSELPQKNRLASWAATGTTQTP